MSAISYSVIASISHDALSEFVLGDEFHELCEDHFSGMHVTSPNWLSTGKSMQYLPESVEIVEIQKCLIS